MSIKNAKNFPAVLFVKREKSDDETITLAFENIHELAEVGESIEIGTYILVSKSKVIATPMITQEKIVRKLS